MSHREKLLRGAVECLREKGYARTTARDLVAASGTNLASIGYHFGNKEGLLNEAIAEGFREWTSHVEREAFQSEAATTLERLERSLVAMIDRFEEVRPFLVAFVEAFPQAVRSPDLRERIAGAYEESRAAGADMVRRSFADEGVELGAEAEVLASVVMALCDGLMLQWLVDPERTPGARDVMQALWAALAAAGRDAGGLERDRGRQPRSGR